MTYFAIKYGSNPIHITYVFYCLCNSLCNSFSNSTHLS